MTNSHDNQEPFEPRPLPSFVSELCEKVMAEPRLIGHLRLVHDAATEIVAGLHEHFPDLAFDEEAVLFGSATHDLGKVLYPQELTGPGHQHEEYGPGFLERHGVPPHLAKFTKTHASWSRERLLLEDLLVAVADTIWKGQRLDDLESQVTERIAEQIESEQWEVFSQLDSVLQKVAERGEERLAWQAQH